MTLMIPTDATVDQPDVLLQTGCPDCLVSKEDKSHLLLFSKVAGLGAFRPFIICNFLL